MANWPLLSARWPPVGRQRAEVVGRTLLFFHMGRLLDSRNMSLRELRWTLVEFDKILAVHTDFEIP